jgi:HD-GYP domain-containing protein (c-di-GMP phosphodiesterase class II)
MTSLLSSSMHTSFLHVASLAFSVCMAILAGINGRRRRDVKFFILAAMAYTVWTLMSLLEVLAHETSMKLFWNAFHWPFMIAFGAACLLFALAYVDPASKKTTPTITVLLTVSLVLATLASAMTAAGMESLLYLRYYRADRSFSPLAYKPSALAVVFSLYFHALLLASAATVARHAASHTAERRKGAAVVFAGFSILLAGNVFGVFTGVKPGVAWVVPFLYVASMVVFAYGLFSERLFGSLTKARRAVMDTLLDPVFVLGKGEAVVDCNAAASTLLGAHPGDLTGRPARELFADWPSSVVAALGFSEAETELDLPDRDGSTRRSYRITVASSSARDRSEDWKLLVFNDITGQKSDARDMASTNEELEFWVKQRTAALRLEVAQRTSAEERLRELNEEITKTQREILWTLSEVVENRSRETAYHVVRVGEYARLLSQGYGLSAEEVEIITAAAPMHDVGKIAIPDSILSKPGQLTDDEREQMKRHTTVGKEILGSSQRPLLRAASIIAHEHHERWDGKGYPLGTAGTDISLSGRIVSLCDVFDALYTKRVYKEAWPLERVLDLFRAESGKAFEPRLVNIFFERLDDILVVTERLADVPVVTAG